MGTLVSQLQHNTTPRKTHRACLKTMKILLVLCVLVAHATAFINLESLNPLLKKFGWKSLNTEDADEAAYRECHLFGEFLIALDEWEIEHNHKFDTPEEMMQWMVKDWGGDDECVSLTEFIQEWNDIKMEGPPQNAFFNMMDQNNNGCISQPEMIQSLTDMGTKCLNVPL